MREEILLSSIPSNKTSFKTKIYVIMMLYTVALIAIGKVKKRIIQSNYISVMRLINSWSDPVHV